jgi:hypothetical protein
MKTMMMTAGLALIGLTGCATQFTGTAPAGDGKSLYVSGSYQGFFGPQSGRVWKCPAKTKGSCEDVNVTFE